MGEISHEYPLLSVRVLGTYAQFLLGWLAVAIPAGVYAADYRRDLTRSTVLVLGAWLGADVVAQGLRSTSVFPGNAALTFGIVAFLAFLVLPSSLDAVRFVIGYLAIMNVGLAVFNMLPGFPMDGGRVLRALLARNRPHARATQIASEVGKTFAFALGLLGLFAFSPIMILLAFFIYIAASGEAQQSVVKSAFQGVTVGDIMTPGEDLLVVDPQMTISELLGRMLTERHTGYPVVNSREELIGMVTLDHARSVTEVERDAYTVEDVMDRETPAISPAADAFTALQAMQEHGVGRLPVVDDAGNLAGILSKTDLMTAFNVIQSRGDTTTLFQQEQSSSDFPSVR